MVEGQARKRNLDNAVSDSDMVFEDILRSNANRIQTLRFQPHIPPLVAQWPIAHLMRDTVNLEYEPCIRAIEINAKVTARVLPAKLHTLRLAAQQTPQQDFG
jgi:hypothetical protein